MKKSVAEKTMRSELDRKQVSISMGSPTASDRSFAAGGVAPRSSPPGGKLSAPLEYLDEVTANPKHDEQEQEIPLVKKVAAEFIGTFILVFTVLSTIVADAQHGGAEGLLGVAASAGLAVVAVVLSVVHISGSHLNPAVSLAMAAYGHLPRAHALPYVAAQTLGSVAAAFLARVMYHPAKPAVMATVPSVGAAEAFFLELVLTFVLMFVITAVATDPASSKELIAVAIASAITMNALVGGPSTGPSMNPARTVGAAVATGVYTNIWVYLVATPLGAIAGAGAYTLIKPSSISI